jgi:hypothetical protein
MTCEQQPEAAGQLIMVCSVQAIQNLALRRHQLCQCGIDRLPANLGQLDQNAAAIIRVIMPGD